MELSPIVRAYLDEPRFGVLATVNANGTVQQSVVWYELQAGRIMMNTKRGRRKDRNLLRTHRASLCVEDGYRYVSLEGPILLIDDQASAQLDIERLAIRYGGPEAAAKQMANQFSHEERVTIYLTPERVDAYSLGA